MLKTKTHFEQVPLEIVEKMIEEQIQRESATEEDQGPNKCRPGEIVLRQRQSRARSANFLRWRHRSNP